MPWSAQQQQSINTYDKNILVAAAAGSGKTSVLVERVIQRIVNKTCDINQILVVTFTTFRHHFFNDTATTEIYTLSLHDALPISSQRNYPIKIKSVNSYY